jgi:hypothetical protein
MAARDPSVTASLTEGKQGSHTAPVPTETRGEHLQHWERDLVHCRHDCCLCRSYSQQGRVFLLYFWPPPKNVAWRLKIDRTLIPRMTSSPRRDVIKALGLTRSRSHEHWLLLGLFGSKLYSGGEGSDRT